MAAALEVLAECGVAGTTHRRIAAAADVPLGSVTYYFAGLGELIAAAFTAYVAAESAGFAALFDAVGSRAELVDVLVGITRGEGTTARSAVLGFELHLAALRDPALRELTAAWTADSRRVLSGVTDEATAPGLDALLEGAILQGVLGRTADTRDAVRLAVTRVLGPVDPRRRR